MRKTVLALTGLVGAIGLLALAARAEWFFAKLPESNCVTSTLSETWSPDHAYKASMLEKSCNMGESIFYSVRIDAVSPPLGRAWFVPGYELENDMRPAAPPSMTWVTPRRLEIAVSTRTLAGTLVVHKGGDLTLVRQFVPTSPGAFPNY